MMRAQLQPIVNRLDRLEERMNRSERETQKVKTLIEAHLLPMQRELSAYGMSTYRRYETVSGQTESMEQDLHILMRVVAERSKELSKPS